MAWTVRFRQRCATIGLGAHTVDLCQWANQADETLPIEYIPSDTQITCRYANGVKLVIDFLEQLFGDRGPRWVTRLELVPCAHRRRGIR
ncbi:MAG: hypothetical protein R3C56_09030 [Pirellulaceae bacterium]